MSEAVSGSAGCACEFLVTVCVCMYDYSADVGSVYDGSSVYVASSGLVSEAKAA